jgi:hypothetical protein
LVTRNEIYLALDYFEEKALEYYQKLEKVVQKFRDYFEEFWISKFEYWNISRFEESFGNLKRTNNCVERYNRRLNTKFPVAHLSILQFVSVLRHGESYY